MGLSSCSCSCSSQYDLTISSTIGGSVTVLGEGTFPYEQGTVLNLIAAAEEGYQFVKWWTSNVGTIANVNAASTTITMNADYFITANFEQDEAVHFADPNLEAAIREAINIPERPIYPSDLKGLTSLDADQRNIADLAGLEHCTNLTSLYLSSNQISDISPLVENAGLAAGDYVYLTGNPLSWDSINIYIPQLQARGVTVDY